MNEVSLSPASAGFDAQSRWYVVTVPEFGDCRVEVFEDERAVADFLRAYVGQAVWCYVFYGWRAMITRGPMRVLRLPDGRTLPLYAIEQLAGEEDESGYLGPPEQDRPLLPDTTIAEEIAEDRPVS